MMPENENPFPRVTRLHICHPALPRVDRSKFALMAVLPGLAASPRGVIAGGEPAPLGSLAGAVALTWRPGRDSPVDLYEYLRRVDERIADCVLRIANYESIIPSLPRDGPEMQRAATLLGALRHAEQMHQEHRERLLAKITEQEAARAAGLEGSAAHCPSKPT